MDNGKLIGKLHFSNKEASELRPNPGPCVCVTLRYGEVRGVAKATLWNIISIIKPIHVWLSLLFRQYLWSRFRAPKQGRLSRAWFHYVGGFETPNRHSFAAVWQRWDPPWPSWMIPSPGRGRLIGAVVADQHRVKRLWWNATVYEFLMRVSGRAWD